MNERRIPELKPGQQLSLVDGVVAVGPRIEKTCRGLCGGDRSNTESPARVVSFFEHGKRKAAVMCTCCNRPLRLEESQGAPALDPRTPARHRRFACDTCQYGVVLLADIGGT